MGRLTVKGKIALLEADAMRLISIVRQCEPLARLDAVTVRRTGHPDTLPPGSYSSVHRDLMCGGAVVRVRPCPRDYQRARNRIAHAQKRLDAVALEIAELRTMVEANPSTAHLKMSFIRSLRDARTP